MKNVFASLTIFSSHLEKKIGRTYSVRRHKGGNCFWIFGGSGEGDTVPKRMGGFDGRSDVGVEGGSLQDGGDVFRGVSRGVELLHHTILEGKNGYYCP